MTKAWPRNALIFLAPGIAAGMLYLSGMAIGNTSRLNRSRVDLEAAKRAVPSEESLILLENRKAEQRAEVDRLKGERDALVRNGPDSGSRKADRSGPVAAERLSRIMIGHGIHLGEEGLQQNTGNGALPASIGGGVRGGPSSGLRLRHHQFSGSYLGMMEALQEIAESDLEVVLVRLTMKRPSKPGEPLSWTMVVWM